MARTKTDRLLKALKDAARVASVMVDGDEATRIITDRAMRHIANPDPQFRFMSGDYYDVDHDTFLRMKKTLLRLERLLPFACHTALWVKIKGMENHLTVAVQNGSLHRYWTWAEQKRPIEAEMAACIRSGEIVEAPIDHPSHTLTVLAPVRNSLGDVVGLVEFTSKNPAAKDLAPAWN